jgi:predicted transcriptional regulator
LNTEQEPVAMMSLRELMQTGDPYNTREIAEMTGRPFLSVASQLNHLVKMGLVRRAGKIAHPNQRPLTIWQWVVK